MPGSWAVLEAMGAQQAKERGAPSGASVRAARGKPRVPKDPRTLGSNIFTEHSGQYLTDGATLAPEVIRRIRLFAHATFGHEDVADTKSMNKEAHNVIMF